MRRVRTAVVLLCVAVLLMTAAIVTLKTAVKDRDVPTVASPDNKDAPRPTTEENSRSGGESSPDTRVTSDEPASRGPLPETAVSPAPNLAGFVVDEQGNPVKGARVRAVFLTPYVRTRSRMAAAVSKADDEGRFELLAPEGVWIGLSATRNGYKAYKKLLRQPDDGLWVVLTKYGAISGRVVDGDTGSPITRFRVHTDTGIWDRKNSPVFDSSRVNGKRFRSQTGQFLLEGIRPGKCVLTATAKGYGPVTIWNIEVRTAHTAEDIVFRMPKPPSLAGMVVGKEGLLPIPGAIIERELGHERRVLATTGENGCFEVSGLRVGTFTLHAKHDGYAPLLQTIELSAGETTTVTFCLSRGGAILGRVVDAETREPVAAARVRADATDPSRVYGPGTTTDDQGAFAFQNLPVDTYTLVVSHQHYATRVLPPIRLTQNQVVEGLLIQLAEGARLVGAVRGPSGTPVKAAVALSAPGPCWASATTDKNGNYLVEHLNSGTYAVAVETSQGNRIVKVIEVAEGGSHRLDFAFAGSYPVKGVVTVAGQPVRDVGVSLRHSDPNFLGQAGHLFYRTTTNEEGHFSIEGVPQGTFDLLVGPRERPWDLFAERTFTLGPQGAVLHVDIPVGGISGRLLNDSTSEPITDVWVFLLEASANGTFGDDGSEFNAGSFIRSEIGDGTYNFQLLADGRYYVYAQEEGYGAAGIEVEVADGRLVEEADIRLARTVTVNGTIRAADPSVDLQEATLTIRDAAGRPLKRKKVSLSSNGQFALACLSPGEYVLEAASHKTAWATAQVLVRELDGAQVHFRLPVGGTLLVDVRDMAGQPIRGAFAKITDREGRQRTPRHYTDFEKWAIWSRDASSSDGHARITHLVPGRYGMTIQAAGYETAKRQVEVRDGKDTRVKVVLERAQDE